jgi:hypothetical protein
MRVGWLVLDDTLVRSRQQVEILEVRDARVHIRAIARTKVAIGEPWMKAGSEAWVPVTAITDITEESLG